MSRFSRARAVLGGLLVLALPAGACHSGGGVVSLAAEVPRPSPDEEPFELLVWRAGRPPRPGLAAARAGELEVERTRALELLRGHPARLARLEALLSGPDDGAWCAAARTTAALELYELADTLAVALEPGVSPRRQVAARWALHELYGRWFRSREALQPFLTSVFRGRDTRLFLAALREEEQRSRERLLAQLAHTPEKASDWLSDPDPGLRAGAARLLAQLFAQPGADLSATLELLIAHLETEFDAAAFQEGLAACLRPLEQAPPDHPRSARLRELLTSIARTPGDPRADAVAGALARLRWRMDGERDAAHVLTGVEDLGRLLARLADEARTPRSATREPPPDVDALVAVIGALRRLCEQAGAGGLGRELSAGAAHDALLTLLRDPVQAPAVRAAAAAAAGPVVARADAPVLAAVLLDLDTGGGVKHALLGSLRPLLLGYALEANGATSDDPPAAIAPEVPSGLLDAVALLSGVADADLRRRALGLLADRELEPVTRRLDPGFLVQRLARETSPEASVELLTLIRRFGRPDMLGELLSVESFDRLAGDPARLPELASTLQALIQRSARGAMSAAQRLAAVSSEPTLMARLRHALSLVASVDDSAAFEFYPREQRAICEWTWRLWRAGVSPRDALPQGLAFEQRLLDVHLPRSEEALGAVPGSAGQGADLGEFERQHLTALLRADLFLAGVGRGTRPQVEAAFEAAYALAGEPERERLVLRDRARFRAAGDEGVKALADYRRVLEAEPVGDEPPGLLTLADLRSALTLLEKLSQAGGSRSVAAEAAGLQERIVRQHAWRSEPATVRMQDLRDLARRCLEARDRARLLRLSAELGALPLTQTEPPPEGEPRPVWAGLTRESAWFQELIELRGRVRAGLEDLGFQG